MRLRGVSVRYEGEAVLESVDLDLRRGDGILLIGPSGCGKSTLAMLLAGLIPGSVEAEVTGTLARDPAMLRPGAVGYVFQDPEAQFCQLSLGREIAFGLENSSLPTAEMPTRVQEALRAAGLDADPEEVHAALSGGMKQKLAIAAALALKPEILILDEPTANLDPQSAGVVFREIQRLKQLGQTLIVIEHRFTALAHVLPRTVALRADGAVAFDGLTRDELQTRRAWLVEAGVLPAWQGEPQRDLPPAPPAEPAYALRRASFTYAPPAVVRRLRRQGKEPPRVFQNLDLDIPKGRLTAIVGPNGSGKSTLLRVLAGFDRLSEGTLDGPSSPAYAFQNPEHQFIYERVADELASRYLGDGPVPAEILALLAQFGLAGHAQQSPFALSQGQKRRLSVAAMLVQDHGAYLLDEPTFGQDARTQEAIMARLAELVAEGRTVVLTTHDMDLVRRHAQHVVVLAGGGIIYSGPPKGLFAEPGTMRRAHLLADRDLAAADDGPGDVAPAGGIAQRFVRVGAAQAGSLAGRLNPAVKLLTVCAAMGVALFAHTIVQGILLCALPVGLMLLAARLSPRQVALRLLPFVLFFVLYTWTLTAYAAVPSGAPTWHFLFFRLSVAGFHAGLVLALRMLSSVAFGVLFVSTTDITDLVVSLCQNFRVPPKFAYGSLAGLRFFPLFEEEWQKIRRARRLRGRRERWRLARVATYALPLLSQAIRLGERVAIAMEARGFRGAAAESPDARTYYRPTRVAARDLVALLGVTFACVLMLYLGR